MRSARSSIRSSPFSRLRAVDNMLRWPVAYCIAGIALALGFESVRASWWGLAILSGLIALYGFLAKGDKDEGRFQTGDNCYFIGFVYTLSIITASLILDAELLLRGSDQQSLLTTIGIALGTSVVGMVARFWLAHDIRVSQDALDEAVRKAAHGAVALEGTVEKLRVAVAGAAEAIEEQSRTGTASLAVLFETVHNRLDSAARQASKELQTVTSRAIEQIGQQTSTLSESTTNVARELRLGTEAHVEAMRGSLGALASSLNRYGQQVEASVKKASETLEQTGDALQTLAKEAVQRFGQQASSLSTSTTSVLKELQQGADAHVRVTRESLDLLSSSLASYTQALDTSVKDIGETLDRGVRQAVMQIGDGVAQAFRANQTGLVELAQRDDVSAIGGTFAQLSKEAARLNDQVSKLASVQESLTAEVEQFTRLLAERFSAGEAPARSWGLRPWRRGRD